MLSCWASIFETTLDEAGVLPFGDAGDSRDDDGLPYWWIWLSDRTMKTGTHLACYVPAESGVPVGYSILCGWLGPNDTIGHAVVCLDGEIVHDPLCTNGEPFRDIDPSHYIAFLPVRSQPGVKIAGPKLRNHTRELCLKARTVAI